MSPKPKHKHRTLPSRMVPRSWTTARGEKKTAYYYEHPRDEDGKRNLERLGTDLVAAKRKWAEIESIKMSVADGTVEDIYKRYMLWANNLETSNLSSRTIRDREQYWKVIGPFIGHVPMDHLPAHFALEYFEKRSAKISAKKELKFLSLLCNWARARKLMTVPNPFNGILRELRVNESRDIYVTDAQEKLVYDNANQVVRDVMDLAQICTLRPGECWGIKWTDAHDGYLHIELPKTRKSGVRTKRVAIEGDLKRFLDRVRKRSVVGTTILANNDGQPLSPFGTFRYHFDLARKAAAKEAEEKGIEWQEFQFRDLRAKVVTDRTDSEGLEAARVAAGHTTQNQTRSYNRARQGEKSTPNPRRRR